MDTLKVYNEYYFGRIYRKIRRSIGLQQTVIYGDELTLEFIRSIFNNRYQGEVIDFSVEEKSLNGGLNSSIQRINLKWKKQDRECGNFQIFPDTVIMKSVIESFDRIKFSIEHSQSREADFYQYHLSSLLSNNNNNNNKMKYPFIPMVYYSNKTYCGSFSMILQDISPPVQPSSTISASSYILSSLAMGNQCWGIPEGTDISGYDISWIVENCFIETSKLHIDFWRDKEILLQHKHQQHQHQHQQQHQQQQENSNNNLSWLKNLDYYNGIGKEKYINYFEIKLKNTWEKSTIPLIEKLNKENKLKHVDLYKQVVNEYFQSFIKWESFQKRIDINQSNTPFTMVHGDFHAGNIMIPITIEQGKRNKIRKDGQIYFLDYSEVGIGCPFSDISQFVISNCSIEFRRENEKRLFTIYHEKLIQSKKVDSNIFNFDYCFYLYKRGGIEKWIWFNILLSEMVPEFAFIFYFNQLSTFIFDHYDLNLFK
ncbi:hypothetical protein ACTA71_009737 [Dictyostelium dimigraforme]